MVTPDFNVFTLVPGFFYIHTHKRIWGTPILKLAVDVVDPLLQYTDSQLNEAKLFIISHCEYDKTDFTTTGQLYIVFILSFTVETEK